MDYRRWKNSRYGSRAKPVPGQNNSTNPTSKFGAGITGYVETNRAQVAAGSSKAGALMLLSESKFLQAEAVQGF
jgi:hypothetical protein